MRGGGGGWVREEELYKRMSVLFMQNASLSLICYLML